MIDRNKVIEGLEMCTNISQDSCLMFCPYKDEKDETYSGFCEQVLKQDALALLKEQEPKAAIITYQNDCCKDGKCPSCGHELDDNMHPKYCGYCGQAVKWE